MFFIDDCVSCGYFCIQVNPLFKEYCMKFFKLGFALLAASLAFTACGDDGSSASDDEEIESSADSSDSESSASKSSDSKSSKSKSSASKSSDSKSSASESSDSKSSGSKSSDSKSSSSSKGDLKKDTVRIDESKKTLIIDVKESKTYCTTDKNHKSFSMKDHEEVLYEPFKYAFVGDTLVMYECEPVMDLSDVNFEYCSIAGSMYTGGKKGNLQGSWKNLGCIWDSSDKKSYCGIPGVESFESINIGKDYVETKAFEDASSYSPKEIPLYDTYFMEKLWGFLMMKNAIPSVSELNQYYTSRSKEENIKIGKKTDNSISFAIKDVDFKIERKKAEWDDHNTQVVLSVSVADSSCDMEYESRSGYGITSEFCDAKYAEYYSYMNLYGSSNERVFVFERNGMGEFEKCLEGVKKQMFPQGVDFDDGEKTENAWKYEGWLEKSEWTEDDWENAKKLKKVSKGSIDIDAEDQSFITTIEDKEDYCLSGDQVFVGEMDLGVMYVAHKYEFNHDTLHVYNCDDSNESVDVLKTMSETVFSECYYDALYVGGKAGNLNGTWKKIPDEFYDHRETIVTIKDGSIEKTVVDSSMNLPDIYKSVYFENLLKYLDGTSSEFYSIDVFYSAESYEKFEKDYGIKFSKKSAKKASFSLRGVDFTVELNKAKYLRDGDAYTTEVTVTAGRSVCKFMNAYRRESLVRETCSDESSQYYTTGFKEVFKDGEFIDYNYVDVYDFSNLEDFSACLDSVKEMLE